MDAVTQQNAALVEQAAAAAESLQEQASNLAQVVNVFRLDEDSAALPQPLQEAPRAPERLAAASGQPRPRLVAIAAGSQWEAF